MQSVMQHFALLAGSKRQRLLPPTCQSRPGVLRGLRKFHGLATGAVVAGQRRPDLVHRQRRQMH